MKILLSRTMVNVFDALLKVTIDYLLRIIFIIYLQIPKHFDNRSNIQWIKVYGT